MIQVSIKQRHTRDESYLIRIGRGLGPRLTVDLRKRRLGRRYVIVTDSQVHARYGEPLLMAFRRRGLTADLISFPAGEASKTRRVRDEIEDGIIELGVGRDAALVALGGGVVGDMTGFVAATYNRGIPYVQIPTTLIGMVDSAIGGKTGINHSAGKNLIGAFHNPAAVYVDVDYLKTLPPRHFASGLAEVVKCGVIAHRAMFQLLETQQEPILGREPEIMSRLIEACCRIKGRVVAADPRESNRRKILNFGHTVGHALETLSGYRLTHGEAVAIGMVAEAHLASRAGLLASSAAVRLEALLERLGLPTAVPLAFEPAAILEVARRDKKTRLGKIAYALPVRIGAMANIAGDYAIPVDDGLAAEVLQELRLPAPGARRRLLPVAPPA
ncbi:MAG TPA: 3-dehydroquinate synthase [Candidatus Polarisedimenticolia bacterium]|nr:3-dehydroquinate synthase [Candidatus Polarisedimenticolia bacterium]